MNRKSQPIPKININSRKINYFPSYIKRSPMQLSGKSITGCAPQEIVSYLLGLSYNLNVFPQKRVLETFSLIQQCWEVSASEPNERRFCHERSVNELMALSWSRFLIKGEVWHISLPSSLPL